MPDLYDALGLPPDASPEDIKKAHRRLSRQHHPDTGDGDRERFDLVQRSALILRDPDKRKKYDETGETSETVDNTQAKIAEVLCGSFRKIYESKDVDYTDLVGEVRKDIQATMDAGEHHKLETEKGIKKAEKALKRLKFKGSGSNLIGVMLEQMIRDKKKVISDTDDALEIFKAALEVLVGYEYEADKRDDQRNPFSADIMRMMEAELRRGNFFGPTTNP